MNYLGGHCKGNPEAAPRLMFGRFELQKSEVNSLKNLILRAKLYTFPRRTIIGRVRAQGRVDCRGRWGCDDFSSRRFSRDLPVSLMSMKASTVSFRMDRPRRLERLGRATLRWGVATLCLVDRRLRLSAGSSPTLSPIKARGSLLCGVNEGLPGFSYLDERGIWTGFDVDFCRAIAAAILGDPKKVKLVPLSADARFQALRDGKIDVLARNSTWTMGRETEYGLTFVGVTYYHGQGFMVPRALRINWRSNSTARKSAYRSAQRPSTIWPTSSAATA